MSEKGYLPSYSITDKIVNLVSDITEITTLYPWIRLLMSLTESVFLEHQMKYAKLKMHLRHMAPPANQVPYLIKDLVDWAKKA